MCLSFASVLYAHNEERKLELQSYFWNSNDTLFQQVDIPAKWENESAVVLAKKVEYSVNKKTGTKLIEHYRVHQRVKILDDYAVKDFTEFSFGESRKMYAGFFSSSKIDYYVGVKVVKPDGTEVIVDNADAIKKEMESGRSSYAYNKIAVPNLQKGDIVDYYYCYEKKFPSGVFHDFSPVYYEFNEKYPIVNQELRIDVLRYCYLNAKSINGAPELERTLSGVNDEVNTFVVKLSDCERINEESWIRPSEDVPILKFQAYYNSPNYEQSGFQAFYGTNHKIKSEINPQSLVDITRQFHVSIANGYHVFNNVYRSTIKYLKYLQNTGHVDNNTLVREGYFFIREYWYQQNFHITPQNVYVLKHELDNMLMTTILSGALAKVKCNHEVIYFAPKELTRMDDLLFLGELVTGIKSIAEQPVIITAAGPNGVPGEISEQYRNVEAYSVYVSKKPLRVERFQMPQSSIKHNITNVESDVVVKKESDSLFVKSRFTISGECKNEWDSVLFVKQVIRDEFDSDKYRGFITEGLAFSGVKAQKRRSEQILLAKNSEYIERKKKINEKINEYYNISGIEIDTFRLVQSGRWTDNPDIVFEIEYHVGGLINKVGRSKLLSIGKLIARKTQLIDKDRQFDIYFPMRQRYRHILNVNWQDNVALDGVEGLNQVFDNGALRYSIDSKADSSSLKILLIDDIRENHIKQANYGKVREYLECNSNFTDSKLRY